MKTTAVSMQVRSRILHWHRFLCSFSIQMWIFVILRCNFRKLTVVIVTVDVKMIPGHFLCARNNQR